MSHKINKKIIARIIIWALIFFISFLYLNHYFLWSPKILKYSEFLLPGKNYSKVKIGKPFVVFVGEKNETEECRIKFKLNGFKDENCHDCGFLNIDYRNPDFRDGVLSPYLCNDKDYSLEEKGPVLINSDFRLTLLDTDDKSYVKLLAEKSYTETSQCNDAPEGYKECAVDVMKRNPQAEFCDKLTENNWKNLCYTNVAAAKDNGELCRKITDNLQKNKCYIGVVWTESDLRKDKLQAEKWCDEMADISDQEWNKDMCHKIIGCGFGNKYPCRD